MKHYLLFLLFLIFYYSGLSQVSQDSLKTLLLKKEWLASVGNDNAVRFYVNTRRFKIHHNVKKEKIVQTWIKKPFNNLKIKDTVYENVTIISLVEFNCNMDEMRILKAYVYDIDENLISGGDMSPQNSKWEITIPSSEGDDWIDIVCSLSKYF